MCPNPITIPKEIEEYAATLPPKEREIFWKRVAEEVDRFSAMTPEEQEAEILRVDQERFLVEEQLRLLEMEPKEREAELKRMEERAQKLEQEAEQAWQEAVAGAVTILIEEDAARRKAEAEAAKTLTAEKTIDLIESFKAFLAKQDLPGCGAVLKKLAASGRFSEILNYYGYPGSAAGANQFFNEILIGKKIIIGEKAFENFLWQQKVYSLEQDLSCLALGLNQWSLSFLVGRKAREWYQLTQEEHLLAVLWALKKIKPEVAARTFGKLAYGALVPREKFNLAAGSDFELGREGKLILLMFADAFLKHLANKNLNPEAAAALYENIDELEAMGMKPTFIEALEKYMEQLRIKPEMAKEVEKEFEK